MCCKCWLQVLPGEWPTLFCSLQGSRRSCLPLQSLRLPGKCLDHAAAARGPYCWPCCFRPPWKRVAGAWRAASVRTSPRKVTCWYVGHSCHLGLGVRWNWGRGWGRGSTKESAMGKGKFIPRGNWVTQPRSGADPRATSALDQEGEKVLQGDGSGPPFLFNYLCFLYGDLIDVSYLEILTLK